LRVDSTRLRVDRIDTHLRHTNPTTLRVESTRDFLLCKSFISMHENYLGHFVSVLLHPIYAVDLFKKPKYYLLLKRKERGCIKYMKYYFLRLSSTNTK
jgi:hypothetical protein